MDASARSLPMPDEFAPRRLGRRALQVGALVAVLVLVVLLAPGLGDVRQHLRNADPGWVALAVVLELLSGVSYVLMFRGIFCRGMSWRTSWEIAWSELAVGSIVPASGAGGLALGAWILARRGMPAERIARRSVAFFAVKSSVNFVAVAVLGTLLAVGILGPQLSLWLTALPAAMSLAVIGAVVLLPRAGRGPEPRDDAPRMRRWIAQARHAVIDGTSEAIELIRQRDWLVVVGSVGYWAWDNAVLWATFHAFGAAPPLTIILMGYLIGQLGGLLPLPGGIGGIDGGLIGALIVYGAPPAATVAAVLTYRTILFWLPLVIGSVCFLSLQRGLHRTERQDLCDPVPAV